MKSTEKLYFKHATSVEVSRHENAIELSVIASPKLPTFDELKLMTDKELHEFRDSRGFSLLMLAAEAGELEIVQSLIDRGEKVDAEVGDESAVSLAYKGGHHKIVLLLLKNNAKFPQNFNCDAATDELKEFLDLSNEMHERVRNASEENFEELKVFLEEKIQKFQNLRYFYDPTNNFSILKRAILSKNFRVYELLISLNIFLAHHEPMDEINEALTDAERSKLSEINLRISSDLITEPMMILMRNCKLGPDTPKDRDADFMYYIREAFDELFKIPAIAIVLRIVAASRNFKIIFDFKRDSVSFLAPKTEPYTHGLMYFDGKIYVGAKDLCNSETASKVTGVIAHELTHYAMFLVYGNWAKPFKDKDKEKEAQFAKVNRECEKNSSYEGIVDYVYKCYESQQQHAELIVRVPHMMAVYSKNPEILSERRGTFQRLFDFYEQVCMLEMEARLPKIEKKFCPIKNVEKKVKMQKLWNISLVLLIIIGLILSAFGIWFLLPVSWSDLNENEQKIIKNLTVNFYGVDVKFGEFFANDSKIFYLLPSEQIKKTLKRDAFEVSKIFYETLLPNFLLTWENLNEKHKKRILNKVVRYHGVEVKFGELFANDSKVFDSLSSEQIKKALKGETEELSRAFNETLHFKVFLTWSNMTKELQENFLTHEINFQGQKVIIGKITKNREFLNSLNVENVREVFEGKLLKVSSATPIENKIYIERFFTKETERQNSWMISYDDIKKNFKGYSRIFLLSSAPGDGKSTTFRHLGLKLKQDFPHKWIQFVDVKKHIEGLKAYEDGIENKTQFLREKDMYINSVTRVIAKQRKNQEYDVIPKVNKPQFMAQKVLNLLDFEFALFNHLYDSGNVILLWDGVDEIAPKLIATVLDIVKEVAASKNFQFVSTRPHLSKNLQNEFNIDAYKLVPFNEQNRFEFLIKMIASKKFNENGDEVYEKLKGFRENFEKFKEANFERYIEPVSKAMNILKFSEEGDEKSKQAHDLLVPNPLMIAMIFEISIAENFKLENSSFKCFHLRESFIKRKLGIIHEEGPIVQEDTNRNSTVQAFNRFINFLLLNC